MRVKPFIAVIADAEGGTYEYLFQATTRRRVKRDVREWVKQIDSGATIVAIEPAVEHRWGARGRRLLRVAGTFAVCAITITMMIVGLSLKGAL